MKVTSIGEWLMAVFVVLAVSLAEVSVVGEEVDVVSVVVVSLVVSPCTLIVPRATRSVRSIMIFIVYYY